MKRLLIILLSLMISLGCLAGGIKFTASSSRNPVQVGENFQVDFAIENGSVRQFINPNFAPFEVLQGPIQGTRINVGMNGATQTLTLSYILRATKEGRFTIPAATAITNAGSIESNSFVVQVNKAAPAQASPNGNGATGGSTGADLSKMFLSAYKLIKIMCTKANK